MNKENIHHDARKRNYQKPYMPSDKEIEEVYERNVKMKRIYHYTSMDTFYKLIEGIKDGYFTFHAGSVYTMNDSQEMILGYEKILKYLPCVEEKLNLKQEEKLFNFFRDSKENEDIMREFGNLLNNDDTSNFVVSFSSAPDILPMWSLYGGQGTGVCLEFSPYVIKEYYKGKNIEKDLQIDECVYKEDDVKELMIRRLTIIYKQFLDKNNTEMRLNPLNKAKYIATMCGIAGAYVKHICFEYEKEVRMNVFRSKEKWFFDNTKNGHYVTYVNVPIPVDALKGIIIGPAAEIDKVRNVIIMLLRTKGIHIEPTQSKVPYRIY